MTRLMFDAINTLASSIPTNAPMVAGYVDGYYKWHDSDWGMFPNSVKVRIAVFASTNDGHVLDIEPGCSSAAESPAWTAMRIASGLATPSVYCRRGEPDEYTGYTLKEIYAAHDAAGVPRPQVWLASWSTSTPIIPPDAIALQYENYIMLGTDYDLSVCADYWPGVDAAPPVPQPPPSEGGVTQADIQNTLNRIGTAEQQIAGMNQQLSDLAANIQGMKENLTA